MNKLVTIVTPSYNNALYLPTLFASLINQTYKNIQFILVNDGSTDNTDDVVEKYRKELGSRFTFKYIKKTNGGAASAINKGLEFVKGTYFMPLDADDSLEKTAIEKMVSFLEKNKEYGYVHVNGKMIDANGKTLKSLWAKNENREYLFDDLIFEKNVVYIGFMFRKKELFDLLIDGKIFESSGGQNWQLLLPVALNYKCGYIDEKLYNYLVRKNSHSHDLSDIDKKLNRFNIHREIIENTIKNLNVDFDNYSRLLDNKYLLLNYRIYFEFMYSKKVKELYFKLKKLGVLTFRDKLMYYLCVFKLNKLAVKLYERLKK